MRPDLLAPAFAQAGLDPDRVIHIEAGDDATVLDCAEKGLRHGRLGGVVAEVAKPPMIASRRLQLAAEAGYMPGVALRRWRRPAEASDFGQPTAARTCWRVSALPADAGEPGLRAGGYAIAAVPRQLARGLLAASLWGATDLVVWADVVGAEMGATPRSSVIPIPGGSDVNAVERPIRFGA